MTCEKCRAVEQATKDVFQKMFPLASEHDLPWYPSHIPDFLEKRIELEFEERTKHFTRRVCRILCEISPPKIHVEDMARIVVEKAKEAERLEGQKIDWDRERQQLQNAITSLTKQIEEIKLQKQREIDNAVQGNQS